MLHHSGRRVVLPASFIGGPRDMKARYQDAMALVQNLGKPDLFITVTCNPDWPGIKENLFDGQPAQNRPDIVSRVFNAKLKNICDEIFKKGIFGKTMGHTHVIEFQKRGLPHAHILVILHPDDQPHTADQIDQIVRAEIPNPHSEPQLFHAVSRHMIHGPCGSYNPNSPCMENGVCKKQFPKRFCPGTIVGDNSYPLYQRGQNGQTIHRNRMIIDNSWVVPYNPYLTAKYQCHINVEICAGISAVKYLYKYVYKGHDRVVLDVGEEPNEIHRFRDSRWVAAPEACWRIFSFKLSATYPPVMRLDIHLPNQHLINFDNDADLRQVLQESSSAKTMLTAYFRRNEIDPEARQIKYSEFPNTYTWHKTQKEWKPRQRGFSLGRIYVVYPSDPERWFLRLLLHNVTGSTSFEDLCTFRGVTYSSFRSAALARGLLQNENHLELAMEEANQVMHPRELRKLFGMLLAHCQPANPRHLWDFSFNSMVEDLSFNGVTDERILINSVIDSITPILLQNGIANLETSFPELPKYDSSVSNIPLNRNWMLAEEQSTTVDPQDLENINSLNDLQKACFDAIIQSINSQSSAQFFIDGPGGSGKTFLYKCVLAQVRSTGQLAVCCAGSGECLFFLLLFW